MSLLAELSQKRSSQKRRGTARKKITTQREGTPPDHPPGPPPPPTLPPAPRTCILFLHVLRVLYSFLHLYSTASPSVRSCNTFLVSCLLLGAYPGVRPARGCDLFFPPSLLRLCVSSLSTGQR